MKQTFFVRQGITHNPKNNLQKAITEGLRFYDSLLTDDPDGLIKKIEGIVAYQNTQNNRCKPEKTLKRNTSRGRFCLDVGEFYCLIFEPVITAYVEGNFIRLIEERGYTKRTSS